MVVGCRWGRGRRRARHREADIPVEWCQQTAWLREDRRGGAGDSQQHGFTYIHTSLHNTHPSTEKRSTHCRVVTAPFAPLAPPAAAPADGWPDDEGVAPGCVWVRSGHVGGWVSGAASSPTQQQRPNHPINPSHTFSYTRSYPRCLGAGRDAVLVRVQRRRVGGERHGACLTPGCLLPVYVCRAW